MKPLHAFAFLAVGGSVYAQQPFNLDTTFRTDIELSGISSVLTMADGGLLVSGQIRFPDDGQFFRGYARLGQNGEQWLPFPEFAPGGGRITPWNNMFYVGNAGIVRRIHLDGTVDTDFILMTNDPYFSPAQGGDYHLYPDGRVLLTGRHGVDDPVRGHVGLYSLIWFTNTGHYDTTRAPRAANGAIYCIAPLPNGQFYCGGAFTQYEGVPAYALVRVQPDGTLDTTFQAHISWGQPWALLPMADGGVMVGGDFRFEGGTDTLRLMRFLPDGSLDPNFNTTHTFTSTYRTAANQLSMIFYIISLGPDLFAVCGGFNRIDGNVHGGIAIFDSTGNLLENFFQGSGAGPATYMGATGSAIHGIMPTNDGTDDYWIWGSYHGYDDGTTNDTLQRMVSRLHGLTVGVVEQPSPAPAGSLLIRPNPANTWVVFQYRIVEPVKEAYIRVTGIDGRELARIPISAPEGQPVYDTRQVAKGAYTVELVSCGKTVKTGKLVVE